MIVAGELARVPRLQHKLALLRRAPRYAITGKRVEHLREQGNNVKAHAYRSVIRLPIHADQFFSQAHLLHHLRKERDENLTLFIAHA